MAEPPREEEARRALRRLDEQSEKLLGAPPADRPAEDDAIERLGKRIARIISIALFVGLVLYLWRTYLSG